VRTHWRELYREAIFETEPKRRSPRVTLALNAIRSRIADCPPILMENGNGAQHLIAWRR
jgi:hypothetical protein